MTISFRVYGIPQTKGSTKAFMRPGMRFPIITNDNTKNKSWAAIVSGEAQRHRPAALLEGPIRLDLWFHLKKPKSLPKRRPSWPTKKPDLSKVTRSVEDALTGIIYMEVLSVGVAVWIVVLMALGWRSTRRFWREQDRRQGRRA